MQHNEIVIVGNVVTEPQSRTTSAGVPVATFRVASTPRRHVSGEWQDGESMYVQVSCWRRLAQNVQSSVRKGQPVVVYGTLRTPSYEKDGKRQWGPVEVEARVVGHDLARGTASFAGRQTAAAAGDESAEDVRAADDGGPVDAEASAA